MTTATRLRCCLCLHEGTDREPVVMRTVYVGGKGDVLRAECTNRIECWLRIDKAHNLKYAEAI